MRICNAVLLFTLLLWVDPAGAQKEYSLTVSIHKEVRPLSEKSVEKIFARASDLLRRNGCDVKFKLDGPIQTFTSAPAHIKDASGLEAVHSVAADIKIVKKINFCVGKYDKVGFIGCSWRPERRPKTVIVTTGPRVGNLHHILWAHEFGHTTGLMHRIDENEEALMTPCDIQAFSRVVDEHECRHFLAGPVRHYPPGLGPACPKNSAARRRAD